MKAKKFRGKKIVIASHNPGKVREISELIQPYVETVLGARELKLAEPEETGLSFAENSQLKALKAASVSQLPSLADDSGLEIRTLKNAPGIYSARWAGPNKDFNSAMHKISKLMVGSTDTMAQFTCSLTLAWPDASYVTFDGNVKGTVQFPAKGDKGFGYDPIFVPTNYHETFGEMDPKKKEGISHRAIAFNQLIEHCFT